MRNFIWRLVLEDPQHSEDPDGSPLRFLLPNVDLIFCVNFSQHIAEDLQKLVPRQTVKTNEVIIAAIRRLIELSHQKFHLFTHLLLLRSKNNYCVLFYFSPGIIIPPVAMLTHKTHNVCSVKLN
jgi:hypothetical protein